MYGAAYRCCIYLFPCPAIYARQELFKRYIFCLLPISVRAIYLHPHMYVLSANLFYIIFACLVVRLTDSSLLASWLWGVVIQASTKRKMCTCLHENEFMNFEQRETPSFWHILCWKERDKYYYHVFCSEARLMK